MNRKIIYVDNFLTGHNYTPTTGSTLVKLLSLEGYDVVQTSNKLNKVFRLADMLFNIAANKRNSVAMIATYSTSAFYFAWATSLLCRLLHIPYIACLHGGNLPGRIKKSPRTSADIFANSYMNVAVSGYLQNSMMANGWKSVVIPNSIRVEEYPFKMRAECSAKILWVRSFHQIYNPALALYILKSVLEKFPHAHLTMVGPDKDGSLDQCKALATHLKLEDKVAFTGLLPRNEWVELAHEHDIFINTTNFDNLPVSVIEAMALGLITISTNVGGVPYLIKNEVNGLLVEANDKDAFVNAISKLLEDADLSRKVNFMARSKAEEFDWMNIKLQWNKLLSTVPRHFQ